VLFPVVLGGDFRSPLLVVFSVCFRDLVLTVKFRQPSHEFTLGVGMTFVSYPLILTPWYNKFTCACRFWSLVFMQGFNVESKTSGISSLSTS
jgi:hypothetical protein